MKIFRILGLIGLLIFLKVVLVSAAEFPISELDNCRNKKECHLFCEIPQNKAACWAYGAFGNSSNVLQAATGSAEIKVATLGITFPIATLGNCANITECKTYCNDAANQTACANFARTRGLANKESMVERAKEILGCTTKEECRAFCEVETNRTACTEFSRRFHFKPVIKDQKVERAKTELGCTTIDECRALCALSENKQRCEEFGIKVGVKNERREGLIEEAKTELGCTSFEECKLLCQNPTNRDICRNFGISVVSRVDQKLQEKLKQIGNCATVDECRKICIENPDRCPSFPQTPKNSSPSSRLPEPRKSLPSSNPSL